MPTNGQDNEELVTSPPNAFDMSTTRGNNNNNNDNNPELIAEEGLIALMFDWATLEYARVFPRFLMRVIEFLVLLQAVFFFFILIYAHIHFSQVPAGCLDVVKDIWPRNGVLRLEIIQSVERFTKTNSPENKSEVIIAPSTKELVENKFQEINTILFNYLSFTNYINFKDEKNELSRSTTKPNRYNTSKSHFSIVKDSVQSANYIVEYSLDEEYLILSLSDRNRFGIPVMIVTLDLTHNKCYGDSVSQFFSKYLIAYDDILVLYVKSISENEQAKGFMRNLITGEYYKFSNRPTSRWWYILSFFIMVGLTLLISAISNYIRCLTNFVIECMLQRYGLQHALPGFCTFCLAQQFIVDAILSKFFGSTTSGSALWIVILADQYYSLCSRCPITKKQFPKFFYLYHFLFYAYHFRFNGQLSKLALICSLSFIQHSMFYFYHHHVLPHVLLQRANLLPSRDEWYQQLHHRRRQQHQPIAAHLRQRVDLSPQRLVQQQ